MYDSLLSFTRMKIITPISIYYRLVWVQLYAEINSASTESLLSSLLILDIPSLVDLLYDFYVTKSRCTVRGISGQCGTLRLCNQTSVTG
jgi:hypothetical protein